MLSVTLVGDKKVEAKLGAMPPKVHAELYREITKQSLDLERYVKNQKLLGQVLNKISGRLQSSIHSDVRDSGQTITGRVFSAAPMPYAAIHEFGGVIPAHVVEAVTAQALRFMIQGKVVFAKKVSIPAVTMPERSFMRSSLAENKDKIVDGMKLAVARGTR